MALGCAPYNATHTDFKSGPVSDGRIWYIVRFAGGVHISSLTRVYKDPSTTLSVSNSATLNLGIR